VRRQAMLVKGEVGAATGVADPNSDGMVGATKLSGFKACA